MTKPLLKLLQISILLLASNLSACKPKHTAPAPSPQLQVSSPNNEPEEAPSPTFPPDTLPSLRLKNYLDAHLEQILAPLDAKGLKHSNSIINFRNALASDMSQATPAKQPAFQAAIVICNALSNDLSERETAIANLQGLGASKSPASLNAVSVPGHLSAKEIHSEKLARKEAKATNASFANSQKVAWEQRAMQLRQNVQQLYLHEQDIEHQIGSSESAQAVANARQEAIRRYPNLAIAGSKFNGDFVARYTYYQQQQPAYFQDTSWPLRLAEKLLKRLTRDNSVALGFSHRENRRFCSKGITT